MAEETRRIPSFIAGPTVPTAVLLPMRLFAGWFYLRAGLEKFNDGWLSPDSKALSEVMDSMRRQAAYTPPSWFQSMVLDPVGQNLVFFQWLAVAVQVLFGGALLAGAVSRISGLVLALSSICVLLATGDPQGTAIPMALMSATLAIAAAGRYLGVDAIFKARNMQIPIF